VAISHNEYYTGVCTICRYLASFSGMRMRAGWWRTKGVIELDAPMENSPVGELETVVGDSVWASRFAMAAVMSLPVFALYALWMERDTQAVREFRLTVTLVASLPLALLVFLRTHLRTPTARGLLAKSESSIENLQRLQAPSWCNRKSWCRWATGGGSCARNQQSTYSDSGYSDLLADDPALPDRARGHGGENPRAGAADKKPGAEPAEVLRGRCRRNARCWTSTRW